MWMLVDGVWNEVQASDVRALSKRGSKFGISFLLGKLFGGFRKLGGKKLSEGGLTGIYRGRRVKVETSRINLRRRDSDKTSPTYGQGYDYAWRRHGPLAGANKSKFSITRGELSNILTSRKVIQSSITRSATSGNYIRVVKLNRYIGNIAINKGGKRTKVITVITDVKGNLINVFPGSPSF